MFYTGFGQKNKNCTLTANEREQFGKFEDALEKYEPQIFSVGTNLDEENFPGIEKKFKDGQ